jgi:hypothetical protein
VFEFAALAGVGARRFDINHRFARLAVRRGAIGKVLQFAGFVALYRHDWVEQAVDRQSVRGDRRGDRIDKERHVVVNQRDPHETPLVAGRGNHDGRFARFAHRGGFEHEGSGFFQPACFEDEVAGEERFAHPRRERLRGSRRAFPAGVGRLRIAVSGGHPACSVSPSVPRGPVIMLPRFAAM